MSSTIIPIDRHAKRFATLSGLYAVRDALKACYRLAAESDWPPVEQWVTDATRQILDIAVRATARTRETVGTVDVKSLPNGDELVFVATDCKGPGDWRSYARQIRPDAVVAED